MAPPLDRTGTRRPVTAAVEPDRARAYARATNDDNPAYAAGRCVPPVFGVVPTWEATMAVLAEVVPPEQLPMLLHAGHDMRYARPLRAGRRLATVAEPWGVRASRSGTWVTLRMDSVDADDGTAVLEQFATMFVRGWNGPESTGSEPPDHSFPAAARAGPPLAVLTARVDEDQTVRYAAASGDTNRIHLDDTFARSVGLPGVIVHGLCTMAMCGRAVVETFAGGQPERLARLAVRFSRPLFPGSDLVTTIVAGGGEGPDGPARFAFEAVSAGERVIRDGLAEVRA